ncbi:MAG: complex I subunit 5 family protein [Conexivisphaerales archaeon]
MNDIAIYVLLIPFVVGGILLVLNGKVKPKIGAYAVAASLVLVTTIDSILLYTYGSYISTMVNIGKLGSFSLIIDGLNWPIIAGIGLVTAVISVYSYPYMQVRMKEMGKEREWGIYYFLYAFFSVAMLGIVESNNFLLFYIFLEVTLIASFLLIAFYGYGNRSRISLIYLIWTHLGGFLFLTGAFIYGLTLGTFNFYPVPVNISLLGPLTSIVVVLVILGLLIKMAVFGVHMWLPYAHAEAPTPVSALLSPAMIGIGGYAIIRILYMMFPSYLESGQWVLLALSLVTIIYGGMMALKEVDYKRLLAYSSIAQMGYMLMGIATLSPLGILGALLQFFSHAVGKSMLFSSSGVLIAENDNLRDIRKMGGLAKSMPYTSTFAMLGFMDISGLPPTFGFFSKLFILIAVGSELVKLGTVGIIVLVFVLIGFGITPAYSFLAMKRIFFGSGSIKGKEGSMYMLVPMAIIAFVGIITFMFPGAIIGPISEFLKGAYLGLMM